MYVRTYVISEFLYYKAYAESAIGNRKGNKEWHRGARPNVLCTVYEGK